MKTIVSSTLLTIILLAVCASRDTKAAELLETARFEEKQNRLEHATKLYSEIVSAYPAYHVAVDAKARLQELKLKKP